MKIKKTVTEKKRTANRQNAKRSTGPRTEAGKAISRLNSLSHGFYAGIDEVVPRVDGLSHAAYLKLRRDLMDEYKPVGIAEENCVDQMASAILLNRRVKSYESSRIRQAAAMDDAPIDEHLLLRPAREDLDVLTTAQAQIENDRTVLPATYEKVIRILTRQNRAEHDTTDQARGGDVTKVLVDETFVSRINAATKKIQDLVQTLLQRDEEAVRDYYRSKALLPDAEMKIIIQAENRALNKFERWQRNLKTCRQEGRANSARMLLAR